MKLWIEDGWKKFRSEDYNYNFEMNTGYTEVWGSTEEEDPLYSPYGPIICDIEVSTICSQNCKCCYKSNTQNGKNMSFETFKMVFDKLPKYNGNVYVHQIAIGLGDISANPDLWRMMEYCRENNVIPNTTINGSMLTDEIVNKLATLCGAVSVSNYNKDTCYSAVQRLTEAGLKQVNIHQLCSLESEDQCYEVMRDSKTDPRLKKLNAIVFLSLKQKGRGTCYNHLPYENYKNIIKYALGNKINFGSDSCGCGSLDKVMVELKKDGIYNQLYEPCESLKSSWYCSAEAISYPCSFATESAEGIDISKVNNFIEDVWYNKISCDVRKEIIESKKDCIYFEIR